MTDAPDLSVPTASTPRSLPLAEALRNRRLEVWYQPKIDLRRKCLAGAEALVRIRHPQDGLLLPEQFLPALDEQELAQLAEHGLTTVLHDWRVFVAAGFNLKLAIDLPTSALRNVPIASLVAERRPQAGGWPGLILELSEDEIVREAALTQALAPALKAAGVTLSIDDFGGGPSSSSGLRDLPFGELKIGAAVVKDCAADPDNAAVCRAAIDLAHRFGSVAVAQGVESAADLRALAAMGCDFGQGMLIAAAMPITRCLGLLRERARAVRARPEAALVMSRGPTIG